MNFKYYNGFTKERYEINIIEVENEICILKEGKIIKGYEGIKFINDLVNCNFTREYSRLDHMDTECMEEDIQQLEEKLNKMKNVYEICKKLNKRYE